MTATSSQLAAVLADLAVTGRKLVEVSESCLALMAQSDAECRPSPREPEPRADATMQTTLLNQAETLALLRVSRTTLGRLRRNRQKRFPEPVRGRPLRWRRGDLERWIAGGRR